MKHITQKVCVSAQLIQYIILQRFSKQASFHFFHISMGQAHFQSNEISIFWETKMPTKMFSIV